MSEPFVKQVRSTSDPTVLYTVVLDGPEGDTCECPDWQFRHGVCKHLRSVRLERSGAQGRLALD